MQNVIFNPLVFIGQINYLATYHAVGTSAMGKSFYPFCDFLIACPVGLMGFCHHLKGIQQEGIPC